jgi:ligand-binding sensor domain-containing protein/signal transduction histidine kinase
MAASWLVAWIAWSLATPASAIILWNDPGTTLVHENGPGTDILGGAVRRDDSANDTLYFKFHIDPLSDMDTEEYFAAFELFEGDTERLGIGNAVRAWAYSAFFHGEETGDSNHPAAYVDLHSLNPESSAGGSSGSYQYPRRGSGVTIVGKVQFVPGEDDLVTVWLNPDLGPGANEAYQPEGLTTRFNADARFDEIRLRHGGGGDGWRFSDLAIATAFSDFVDVSSARPSEATSGIADGARAFLFESWQKPQGLPQSPVRALLQTRAGYLWIGNDEGLARFDGLRFVIPGVQEGMKAGPVSALLEDRHGALWFGGGSGGLNCWRNGQLTTLTTAEGLPADSITALAEDAGGRIWVGTEEGLVVCQDGRLTPLNAAAPFKGQRITALLKDRQGRMWVGVKDAGVFQFEGDRFVPLTGEALEEPLKDPHCLLVDQGGRVWIGAGQNSVLCLDSNRWHRYRIPRLLAKAQVSSLAEEPDGTVWAGSPGGGLLQIKDGKTVGLPASSDLAGSLIESLLTDREGRLWVGTDAGLNRLRRKSLFTLSQSQGLGLGAAQCMAEVRPGVVWVAKPNDGLYRWDGKSFSRLSAAGLSPHDLQVTALLVTRDGFCWVATANSLLLYKDPIAAADELIAIQSAKPNIISLAEDDRGALWAGTRDGKLWQLRAGQWLGQTNWAQTNAITALVPDPEGTMWVGTEGNGLYRFRNGTSRHIDRSAGLSSDAIRTLYLDAEGTLWIGTADKGLSRWRDGRAANFTAQEGLPDAAISQVLEDDAGRLWLGSSGGIVCVSKRQLDELAAGKRSAVYPQLLGRAEGMLSEECTGGFCPAGLRTRSGLLWFSTAKGVALVDPRVQPTTLLMPNTVLEEVLVDGVPHSLLQDSPPPGPRSNGPLEYGVSPLARLRIGPGKHWVEFRYTGLSFDAPASIRFRYRLEGLDADWVDAGTRRSAYYSYLPPGNYRFRVGARSQEGAWSHAESALNLVALRHFWQTWWFIALAASGLMVSAGGTVRIIEKAKLQRRLKRVEQERALERERTRIAQDLHDEMGAKLCRISFLSEHARRGNLRPNELQDQITAISGASREVLQSLDEIVWAVNPQNDTLEHAASYIGQYALEYFQMTGIQCELDIPPQLPPHPLSSHMRHHLFLATHEALTNILKHSGATRARISMNSIDGRFEIRIWDDGKGFNSSTLDSKTESSPPAAGDGLGNMSRRLVDVGGRCAIRSVPGQGTSISFVIPLNTIPESV